jgi:nitroimidazol reductase NimA-like FMN-containing flavoprotein (pyridoxamine 5'-phosphate oxidase superfamily)
METWYLVSLGDGMMSGAVSAEIEEAFVPLFAAAGKPATMGVFTRPESEGRLHCEVNDTFMTDFKKSKRNSIKRLPKRGYYDRETIYRILDEALICHVGFVDEGQPYVIPINFARVRDSIVLHGAKASRLLKHIEAGNPVCVEATIVDGLVLARSVFHHSVNYRSVVLFGTGRLVTDEQEKLAALEAVTEHMIPGRWREARLPNRKELNATSAVSIQIDEASAKLRVGPPIDEEEDRGLPVWAGVLPLQEMPLSPRRDESQVGEVPLPQYIARYSRRSREMVA